jgi:hypothetical protein
VIDAKVGEEVVVDVQLGGSVMSVGVSEWRGAQRPGTERGDL